MKIWKMCIRDSYKGMAEEIPTQAIPSATKETKIAEEVPTTTESPKEQPSIDHSAEGKAVQLTLFGSHLSLLH